MSYQVIGLMAVSYYTVFILKRFYLFYSLSSYNVIMREVTLLDEIFS